jgi:cell division protein ZapA
MPMIPVTVNGRAYEIACDPGQEQQLQRLGADLAARVERLVAQVGQVGDARLMLMAGLLIADELETLRQGGAVSGPAAAQAALAEIDALADALGDLASRVEAIAGKLEAA